MNHIRTRQNVNASYLAFLPSGTSSNEALHAELNSWSRSTNAMRRSTLVLRLRYYRFVKMMQHYLSTQYPFTHVVTAELMLGRSLYRSIWTGEQWRTWCSPQQNAENARKKATLPLCKAREAEAALVGEWARKRPASRRQDGSKRIKHTTPLTVRRRHSIKSAGVRKNEGYSAACMKAEKALSCAAFCLPATWTSIYVRTVAEECTRHCGTGLPPRLSGVVGAPTLNN